MTPYKLPDGQLWRKGYNPSKNLLEQENPLQFVAKLIDTVAGKPIRMTVKAITGSEEAAIRSVHFRPTHYIRPDYKGNFVNGRSLGDEVVGFTFDFFSMSVGDAWGRDIAGWFDPNVKKDWMDDKGHIKFPEAVNSVLKSTWRYVTYNGGEDWAVAIPYAYFMKGQRALIDKSSPGFKYDFDHNLNGASFKVNAYNQPVGNYNKEGMFDLQTKFMAYNGVMPFGTLQFRELYSYIGDKLTGKHAALYGDPDQQHEAKGVLGTAGDVAKWSVRGMVKSFICMLPAVPFFWITRTPQTKHRGIFINPGNDSFIMHYDDKRQEKRDALYANQITRGLVDSDKEFFHSRYAPDPHKDVKNQFVRTPLPGRLIEPVMQGRSFDGYSKTFGPLDSVFNGIGHANYKFAGSLDGPANWADNHLPFREGIKNALNIPRDSKGNRVFERFTRPTIYAGLSYFPYMYAKAETANLWDTGKMDTATERMIDGAAGLNWGEFKAGAGEVWRAILHQPFADPAREAAAELRHERASVADSSLSDEGNGEETRHKYLTNWRERIISGPPTPARAGFASTGNDASLGATYKIAKRQLVAEQPQKSHAEQEEMRKVLEELHPPTDRIH